MLGIPGLISPQRKILCYLVMIVQVFDRYIQEPELTRSRFTATSFCLSIYPTRNPSRLCDNNPYHPPYLFGVDISG